ncbi:hypothetical protein GGE68_004691 [Rhizobium leguminosarum]|nr:hypothetical protein [Rhizobium leguminosarum]
MDSYPSVRANSKTTRVYHRYFVLSGWNAMAVAYDIISDVLKHQPDPHGRVVPPSDFLTYVGSGRKNTT